MDEMLLLSFYEVMTLSSSVLVAGQNYVLVETTSYMNTEYSAQWSGEVTMLRSFNCSAVPWSVHEEVKFMHHS